jgi:hypothetical protein
VRGQIDAKQDAADDLHGKAVHLGCEVNDLAVAQAGQRIVHALEDDLAVSLEALRAECRMERSAAAAVKLAFSGQEARPEELAPDETWRLRKLRVVRDQHVFDMIGMIQQESRPAEKREANEIAFSGQLLDKCNRIACKTPQPPC